MNHLRDFVLFIYSKRTDLTPLQILTRFTVEEIAIELALWLDDPGENFFELATFARDLYIESDLLEHERESYMNALFRYRFFESFSRFLYSSNFYICSWTIYTIGKISRTENICFLEAAYEDNYSFSNPVLAYRCLRELTWLGSDKADHYIRGLKVTRSLRNWLVLAWYSSCHACTDLKEYTLENMEFCILITGTADAQVQKHQMASQLFEFESHLSNLFADSGMVALDDVALDEITRRFFKAST